MKQSNNLIRKIFDRLGVPVLAIGVITLFILEEKYSLRRRKHSKIQRLRTNTLMGLIASIGLRLILIPFLVRAARSSRNSDYRSTYSPFLSFIARFLILDYGNYQWHKLNHKNPWLWRFHQVHHSDLDLDVSTALRFHFIEVVLSAFYRGFWIIVSGASERLVLIYEILFEAATNFHHSNLKLPKKVDLFLSNFIVTPTMHGIHHSVVKRETDSNFCIILTIWDKLHNTFNIDIPPEKIEIGVPYVREHADTVTLSVMPFRKYPRWVFPNGDEPVR